MLNKIGLIKVLIVQLVTVVLRDASDGCGRLPPFNFNSVPFNFNSVPSTQLQGAHILGVKTWLSTLEIVNLSVFRMRQ